jgi:DHA1 family multidrug resistance protein-like MFS transporter
MTRHFPLLMTVAALFGLGLGIYDFVLPFLLSHWGVSFASMGVIFSVAGVAMFFVRVYVGELSDRYGRKIFYGAALGLGAGLTFATPLAPSVVAQMGLKSARDGSYQTFQSMHQLVLYEESVDKYLDYVGKTLGSQYLAEGLGAMAAGAASRRGAYAAVLRVSAVVFFVAFCAFLVLYRPPAVQRRRQETVSLTQLFGFDLSPKLRLMTIANLIFTVGLSVSHCFVMQLFFARKFGVPESTVGVIMLLHRLTAALPLLVVGWVVKRHLKAVYITFLTIEGVALTASAFIPHFLFATAVWLTHDLFGAGIWLPVQSTLMQRHSRNGVRGRDVSKSLALASLGWIIGPMIAGVVFNRSVSGPFALSGLLMVVAAIVLLWL